MSNIKEQSDDYKNYEELNDCDDGVGLFIINTCPDNCNVEIYKLSEKDKIFIPMNILYPKEGDRDIGFFGSSSWDYSNIFVSDNQCIYHFDGDCYHIKPGIYRIKIKKDGYKTFTQHITICKSKCTNIEIGLIKLSKSADYICDDYKAITYRELIPQKVKDLVWKRDNGRCTYFIQEEKRICGSIENIEFDHIIPISKGGSNTYRNIQILCEKHNRTKSANI